MYIESMKEKINVLSLDNQLCFSLYSASLAMTKAYRPLLTEVGLTYPQYLVMLVLWERDNLSVSSLGEILFLDSGTLTPLLKRMESMKLLVRQRSSEDERQVDIVLSSQGRKLKTKIEHIPHFIMSQTECNLEEIKSLTGKLKKLRTSLNHKGEQK